MKKKLLSILLAAAVVCTSLSYGFETQAASDGTTYYVSTLDGNDNHSGTSENQAFYSLEKINEITLQPGDQVLLENGSVFVNEALHIQGSGSEGAPIVISNYGDADKNLPRIDTNGQGIWYQNYRASLDSSSHKWQGYVSSAVLLYDVEYITIENLEITNNAPEIEQVYNATDVMNRTGVAAVVQNIGTADSIHLNNLYIHDVIGNVYDKHMNNGGIYFTCFTPMDESTGIARYNDVLIENCYVDNVNRWGIAVGYSYTHTQFTAAEISDEAIATYGSSNVVIRNNYVKDAGGDAITLMYCDRPLVEYNVSDGAARQINTTDYSKTSSGRVACGIWPWKCKDAVFQYNEAFDTCYNQDGQAWDADSGDGTVYQYNYSHNNGGGCVMFCYPQAINNIFRYNISQNDLDGLMSPSANPDAHVYNNTFYVAEDVPFIRPNQSTGHMLVENNIFYYSGDAAMTDDWYYQTSDSNVDYLNNLYYNYANVPEEDTAAIVAEEGTEIFVNPGSGPTAPTNIAAGAIEGSIVHTRAAFEGYELAENSPAVDAGKEIADNGGKDFFGNPIVGATDIGAIESQGVIEIEGYTVSLSEDVSINVGEDAQVTLTVSSQEETYNTYYYVLTYDADTLTYKSVSDGATVADNNGTLTVLGYGSDKSVTDSVTLTFTGKAPNGGSVTLTQANIDKAENANTQDAPAATIGDATTSIQVGGFKVTLTDDFTGSGAVNSGEDYTFTAKDPYYTYDFAATMDGELVAVIANGDGTYTIENVTGDLSITAEKTPMSFDVTVEGSGADDVSLPDATATYRTDYTFVLDKKAGYHYQVSVEIDGRAYSAVVGADGNTYQIDGADIKGDIVIDVTKTQAAATTTQITFVGNGSADVAGDNPAIAENDRNFTFSINKEDGYDYTVQLVDPSQELEADEDGIYTISKDNLDGTELTVRVTKTPNVDRIVEVSEYVKVQDGKSIFLITAAGVLSEGNVYAYDGSAMSYSEEYGAYAYLVISDQSAAEVLEQAEAMITEIAVSRITIQYNGDVNGTGVTDVNDAQLTYNMYNAHYSDFTKVSMDKFLRADMNHDKTLTVLDSAAVVELLK